VLIAWSTWKEDKMDVLMTLAKEQVFWGKFKWPYLSYHLFSLGLCLQQFKIRGVLFSQSWNPRENKTHTKISDFTVSVKNYCIVISNILLDSSCNTLSHKTKITLSKIWPMRLVLYWWVTYGTLVNLTPCKFHIYCRSLCFFLCDRKKKKKNPLTEVCISLKSWTVKLKVCFYSHFPRTRTWCFPPYSSLSGKLLHGFKGFAGGIRSIQCHPTLPLVASCGLDRFLRIHDLHSKKLLHKVFQP
jgi:hypothetical protein